MLPLLQEYRVSHHRFPEHLRVALLMALVAPLCALIIFRAIGWWNPWLWGACGMGISLALLIYSAVCLQRNPKGMSAFSRKLVSRADFWFPFYFVILQSMIASLIILFLWFHFSTLVISVPWYVNVILVLLTILFPARRFVLAKVSYTAPVTYLYWNEILRGIWHILLSIFLARTIISLTISDINDTSPENITWQIMMWTPALLYILFTAIMTVEHLMKSQQKAHRSEPVPAKTDDIVERF